MSETKLGPLAIASGGAFVSALSTSLVAVSAPVIAKDLSALPADVGWVLSAYLLVISATLALVGRAADLFGRRRIYLGGFAVFVAGGGACAAAPTLGLLIAARVLQGVGAAMLMAVGPAIVTRSVPPDRRARALGLQLAATYVGLTIGPSVGGVLAAAVGWHAVFVVIAGAGLAGGLAAAKWLEDDHDTSAKRERLDLGGAVLLGGALTALLVFLRRGPDHGWASASGISLAALAATCLAVFSRHESRHDAPLVPISLFATGAFSLGLAGAAVLYVVTAMLTYLLAFHLQRAAGLDPAAAGAIMTAQPAAMAVVAPLSGVIADRYGPRLPSTVGMVAIAAGLYGVAKTASAHGTPLVLSLAIVGVGAGLYVAPNNAMIMGVASKQRQGTAAAMAATARNVGMTFGIALAASLGHALGFDRAMVAAAAIAAVGALLGAVRPVVASAP